MHVLTWFYLHCSDYTVSVFFRGLCTSLWSSTLPLRLCQNVRQTVPNTVWHLASTLAVGSCWKTPLWPNVLAISVHICNSSSLKHKLKTWMLMRRLFVQSFFYTKCRPPISVYWVLYRDWESWNLKSLNLRNNDKLVLHTSEMFFWGPTQVTKIHDLGCLMYVPYHFFEN